MGKELLVSFAGGGLEFGHEFLAGRAEGEKRGAAVGGVGFSFDEALGFQLLEDAGDGGAVDAHEVRDGDGGEVGAADVVEHGPLHAGDAEFAEAGAELSVHGAVKAEDPVAETFNGRVERRRGLGHDENLAGREWQVARRASDSRMSQDIPGGEGDAAWAGVTAS